MSNEIDTKIFTKVTNLLSKKAIRQNKSSVFKTINGKIISIKSIPTAKMEILIIDKNQENTKTLYFKSLDRGSKLKILLETLEIETKF